MTREASKRSKRLDLDGVALIQNEDGTLILEMHDCGWDVEVTLYTDRSVETYIAPVCDGSSECKSHRHIHGCFSERVPA